MAGLTAAWQHRVLCNCGNFCAACARSENIELTGWARSGYAPARQYGCSEFTLQLCCQLTAFSPLLHRCWNRGIKDYASALCIVGSRVISLIERDQVSSLR